jgi:outer membrane protein assembly factor BamB
MSTEHQNPEPHGSRIVAALLASCIALPGCGGRSLADGPVIYVFETPDAAIDDASTPSSPRVSTSPVFVGPGDDAGDDTGVASGEAGESSPGDAPAPDPGSVTSFLENPAHTGYLDDPTLAPPLAMRWHVDLGGNVSYPLIVEGRVYVLARASGGGSVLVALDAVTGAMLWTTDAGQAFAHAYDGGKIFTVTGSGLVSSFDAISGVPGWSSSLPDQYSFSSAPTAYRGTVYVSGAGVGGTVYAVDERNGNLLWTQPVENGDDSAPTVDDTGVYVSYACVQAYAFERRDSSLLWHHSGSCEGGGGSTTVLAGGLLYARDWATDNLVLSAATGAEAGSFAADAPPAFDGVHGFFVASGTLRAEVVATRAVLWSFAGDGMLKSAPLVVGDHVYVGSMSGLLYAVRIASGAVDWSQSFRGTFGFNETGGTSGGGASLAAAQGTLFVPVGTTLSAYASGSSDAGAPDRQGAD